MSRVRLLVVLAEPGRVFVPGDSIHGRVEVAADEACRCKDLAASLGWQTTGEANAAAGNRGSFSLGSGEWNSGDRHSLPFSLTVPEGPPTYAGRNFSLHWSVRAEAALSLAFDAREEAPFEVGAGPAPEGKLLSKEDSGCGEIGCAVVALALLFGGGLPIVFAHRFPGIGYAVAAAIGGILSAFMLPRALAYRRMGKVTVEVGPSPVARGEEIACRVVVIPRKDLKPRRISAVLTAVEKAPKGSGKSRTILTAELAKVPVTLEGPGRLEKGREAVFAGMVPVPADGPPSFEAGDHQVKWKLKVSVEFPVLPDPTWEFEITVG